MIAIETVQRRLEQLHDEMISIRRDLHMHPERSFHEHRTARRIAQHQRALGLEVRTEVGGMGVVATLRGAHPGPTIALRADFDALPIHEQNDVPYASQNVGVMHACGHDAHTAIALGIASALAEYRDELHGNVVFIHQHAEEEDPGGAKGMVEDGALDGVDAIIATHMENYIPVGHVWHSDGYVMASSDDFIIDVHGIGGHAAWPHDTVDAVTIGAHLVIALNQIVSRKLDPMRPVVLTVGAFAAGDTTNVIPGSARLQGTVRTFDPAVRDSAQRWIERITASTCEAFGATSTVTYLPGAPSIKNDPMINRFVIKAATQVLPTDNIVAMEPNMGAEDFSFYTQHVPGAYFFTGSANAEKGLVHPYHHPRFDIDEDSLLIGAKIMAGAALSFLADAAMQTNGGENRPL